MGKKKSRKNKPQYMPTCPFCGRQPPEVKVSDEHVIKQSLQHMATPGTHLAHDTVYRDSETGELRVELWSDPNKNGYQATVRICTDCNTNVFNNLIEEPFADDLIAMVKGEAIALDSDAVRRMATWAAKTAMTRALLDKGKGTPSIPRWQYRWLRDKVCPPPTMLMYFGKAENTPDLFQRHFRFRLGETPGAEGHFTSFVIGHFWFIVAGFAEEEVLNAFRDSVDELFSQHDSHSLVRFWPPDPTDPDTVAPQSFPPGPEASRETAQRASAGPRKLKMSPELGGKEFSFAEEAIPTGPLKVKVGNQMKTVNVVKGRPPGSGPGHPDDRMLFIDE